MGIRLRKPAWLPAAARISLTSGNHPLMPRIVALRSSRRERRTRWDQNGLVTDARAGSRIELELTEDGYVAAASLRAVDGSTAWRINPPDGPQDAFVAVAVDSTQIVLTSWSGWRITTDPVSGSEAERSFTK